MNPLKYDRRVRKDDVPTLAEIAYALRPLRDVQHLITAQRECNLEAFAMALDSEKYDEAARLQTMNTALDSAWTVIMIEIETFEARFKTVVQFNAAYDKEQA